MNNPENFFTRLSALMREQGLTQDDIARGLGTRQSTVSHWVQGVSRPRARTMKQLADFLRVSVQWLDTGGGDRDLPVSMRLRDESLTEVYKVKETPLVTNAFSWLKDLGDYEVWEMASGALQRITSAWAEKQTVKLSDLTLLSISLGYLKPIQNHEIPEPQPKTSETGP